MNLKQKLAIGLCTFYLVSVIGIALSFHFCGGKLASLAVYNDKTSCKYCKAEPVTQKDDGCCKNTKIDVKVEDSHKAESGFKLPKLFNIDLFFGERVSGFVKQILPTFLKKYEEDSPPKSRGVAIHLFNCVFRN